MKSLLALSISALLALPLTSGAQERTKEASKEAPKEESGELRDFGKAVGHSGSGSSSSKEETDEERRKRAQEERERDDAMVDLFADILSTAIQVYIDTPPDTSTGPDEYHTFAQYPYFEKDQGLYKIGGEKDFSVNLKAQFHHESPELMGGGIRLRVSPLRYFSGEVYLNLLNEQLQTRSDRMMLASFFINYHLIRQNTWAFWFGIGDKIATGAGARDGGGLGLNATLEIYPFDPISLHANVSTGSFDEVFTTINYHTNRYTFFAGYQGFFAGPEDLNGIVMGSSLYF